MDLVFLLRPTLAEPEHQGQFCVWRMGEVRPCGSIVGVEGIACGIWGTGTEDEEKRVS